MVNFLFIFENFIIERSLISKQTIFTYCVKKIDI